MNRDDFILLNDNIIYLDNGATTLKPKFYQKLLVIIIITIVRMPIEGTMILV